MQPDPRRSLDRARQLDALGLAIRRAILERLVAGPLSVGTIARVFAVSRPAISQHIRVLRQSDLVVPSDVGNRSGYAINVDALRSLRRYFNDLCTQARRAQDGQKS
jgi:DNA-binding transcriptional ArsR family regulator